MQTFVFFSYRQFQSTNPIQFEINMWSSKIRSLKRVPTKGKMTWAFFVHMTVYGPIHENDDVLRPKTDNT